MRSSNSKELPVPKRRRLKKQWSNWSDLPLEILEQIIGRLHLVDQTRTRAVCKAWSVPNRRNRDTDELSNRHIPAIDELPCWGMKIRCSSKKKFECVLLDPLSGEYVVERSVRGKDYQVFLNATPCASAYGWVLFKEYKFYEKTINSLFLYSPFTTEVIKLPPLRERCPKFQVATFSLNATSSKCAIFLLYSDLHRGHKIYVKLCFPSDYSWKTLEFNGFKSRPTSAVDATYANGVFYCIFDRGQLGAFDVQREKWTILFDHQLPGFNFCDAKLIASHGDLRLLSLSKSLKLFKLDFSEMHWVYENDLNNRVLFIGCTSFSTQTVGETSQLTNTIFPSADMEERSQFANTLNCSYFRLHPKVRVYGSRSCSRRSPLYLKCEKAAKCGMTWIGLPLGNIWRAEDLIKAV